jgi:hypothetical protein
MPRLTRLRHAITRLARPTRRHRLTPAVALVAAPTLATLPAADASADDATWYAFEPTNTSEPGFIGMADWQPQRAGSHGYITVDGSDLVLDGEPIRLWGLNNTYMDCAPPNEIADRRAAWYAKMGFNSLRQHKYANGAGWRGICAEDSWVRFDPEKLDRFDYFNARLIEHGLYIKLSPSFGVRLGKDDRQYLPEYYDEISDNGAKDWPRVPYGAIYYLPEMQQATIDQLVNILEHTNPYTGKKYKDDPAIAFVEAINEDSALWYGNMTALQRSPFLRKRGGAMFSNWLRAKYGDHAGLVAAWGEQAITPFDDQDFDEEHLDRDNVLPYGHGWHFNAQNIEAHHPHLRQRMNDTMRFLYDQQNAFYDRFAEAMRATGYGGLVIGSNWQADNGAPHYLNLHSDSRQDLIDRHNYFAGGRDGEIVTASMLAEPGVGTLSVGLQQVDDKPFMLSEWIHEWPNPWGGEGPAILGAYGFGLQGWDVSYLFQNSDDGGYRDKVGDQRWEVTAPHLACLYPAVARQVRRGDVAESDQTVTLNVAIDRVEQPGTLDFIDRTIQRHDVKNFDSDKVPARTLALQRVAVKFTDEPTPTPAVDPEADRAEGEPYASDTGQLRWWPAAKGEPTGGCFAIDSPGTQALVGFAEGRAVELADFAIHSDSRFASIYLVAPEQGQALADADEVLLIAVARARNTGMQTSEAGDKMIELGEGPVRMEPVFATVHATGRTIRSAHALTHDGLPGRTLDLEPDGGFRIDGTAHQTPYYRLVLD